jgi:hypothetical protein
MRNSGREAGEKRARTSRILTEELIILCIWECSYVEFIPKSKLRAFRKVQEIICERGNR